MTALTVIPSVTGVLTSRAGGRDRGLHRGVQEPDGAVPWTVGEHIDVWNHVEAAMALLVAGEVEAAEAAYAWCARTSATTAPGR